MFYDSNVCIRWRWPFPARSIASAVVDELAPVSLPATRRTSADSVITT